MAEQMSTYRVRIGGRLVRTFKTGTAAAAHRYVQQTYPAYYETGNYMVIQSPPNSQR